MLSLHIMPFDRTLNGYSQTKKIYLVQLWCFNIMTSSSNIQVSFTQSQVEPIKYTNMCTSIIYNIYKKKLKLSTNHQQITDCLRSHYSAVKEGFSFFIGKSSSKSWLLTSIKV